MSETHCPESPDGKHHWKSCGWRKLRCIACEKEVSDR